MNPRALLSRVRDDLDRADGQVLVLFTLMLVTLLLAIGLVGRRRRVVGPVPDPAEGRRCRRPGRRDSRGERRGPGHHHPGGRRLGSGQRLPGVRGHRQHPADQRQVRTRRITVRTAQHERLQHACAVSVLDRGPG